jgi:hypothetical protein
VVLGQVVASACQLMNLWVVWGFLAKLVYIQLAFGPDIHVYIQRSAMMKAQSGV